MTLVALTFYSHSSIILYLPITKPYRPKDQDFIDVRDTTMRISLLLSWQLFMLLFSNLILIPTNLNLVSAQCSDNQKSLLLQAKSGLIYHLDSSVKLVKWNQSVDCCSWPGVVCSNGQVVELDLSNEHITDGVSDSSKIFDLKQLQKLNLGNNGFTSSSHIPARLGELKSLTHLNLSNAGFIGHIPIEISQLTQLVTLDFSSLVFPENPSLSLGNSDLQSLIQNFTSLRELYLDGVNMSFTGNNWGKVLSSSVPDLRVLSLTNCKLRGPIDDSLEDFKSLSVLRLNKNNLSTIVPDFFGNLESLAILSLASTELFGVFPKSVFQSKTLQNLDVSGNPLLQGTLPNFPAIGSLQTLVLRETNFSGIIPESIGNLKKLSKLDLADCSFSGLLPTTMSDLTELKSVDLTNNSFEGSLSSLSSFNKLNDLRLTHNRLTGPIVATNWTNLTELKTLDLRNNHLDGAIPASLFSLPSLQKLQLSQNLFDHLQNVDTNTYPSQLNTLDLSSNNLQGQFPTFVFGLHGINMLALSSNNFSGGVSIGWIQQLRNLSSLDLSFNSLSIDVDDDDDQNVKSSAFPQLSTVKLASSKLKAFPDFLRYQSKLTNLDLSNNQIGGKIPTWIWDLSDLKHLNLSYNYLKGFEGPMRLSYTYSLLVLDLRSNMLQGELPSLPPSALYIDFSRNHLTASLPPKFGNTLSFTYFLSLASNSLEGAIPESICDATYLRVLNLSNNSFSGSIPCCLGQMSETLGVLNLRGNRLNGTIPDNFMGTCKLQTMDISLNLIENEIPRSLANCRGLEVLDVGNNKISDIFPCWLQKLPALRVLVLRLNNFHGSIRCPRNNGSWKMLQIVDLAFNNFSGYLNVYFFNSLKGKMSRSENVGLEDNLNYEVLRLNQLYYQNTVTVTFKGQEVELVKILTLFSSMDLSSNQLEGEISIGELTELHLLNLSHNGFHNHIPITLGNLKQLESLDLSNNELTGKIPSQLVALTFLAVLNLSYNHLEGMIPKGNQFNTFSSTSYIGNKKLCGPPMDNSSCSRTSPSEMEPTSSSLIEWQFMVIGIGFLLGTGTVLAPLVFSKRWNTLLDKQVNILLSLVHWQHEIRDLSMTMILQRQRRN